MAKKKTVEDRVKELEAKIAQQNQELKQAKTTKAQPAPRKPRVLSTKQNKYNEYKEQQWALFKAKGVSFKNMLKDAGFQAGWKKLSATL